MLLAETLRSSTLKLALLTIGLFGTVMFALIGYLYWSTVSYVRNRSDPAIAAEQIALKEAFDRAGRDGLVATISQSIADRRLENGVYLLVDASLVPVGGNLTAWPPGLEGAQGGPPWCKNGRPARRTGQCYARPLRRSRTVLNSW